MHGHAPSTRTDQRRALLLAGLGALQPEVAAHAAQHDRDASFPAEAMDRIRSAGALAAPLPEALGGLGMGSEPAGAMALADALAALGRASLPLGRLYEAHVNALRLVIRFGDPHGVASAASDALAGHLFALWVTDAPDAPLRCAPDGRLSGAKCPCSGAGQATRAVVTAAGQEGETRLWLIEVPGSTPVSHEGLMLHGMRAAANGRVDLTGIVAGHALGADGDYLREPEFSAGAWRGSAVALGGGEALLEAWRQGLGRRGRETDPHQQARFGEGVIAVETARLWVRHAARAAEQAEGDAAAIVARVNLARIAVETNLLDLIRLAQRSLGLAAFRVGETTERLFRDLATYLRQPAPDAVLTEAAAWHLAQRTGPA